MSGGRELSGPEKAELAAKAGADLVVNYRDPDAADQIGSFAGAAGVDLVVEVALGANLPLDLAVVTRPDARIACYAADADDPVLPVRACMNANVVFSFVLLYGVPPEALSQAARDISAALADGALTELPVIKFSLDEVAAAQEAVERGAVGKVLVAIPR